MCSVYCHRPEYHANSPALTRLPRYSGMIYIDKNVWKFCGDHILIKFFFGFIIDIQKNFKKSDKLLH